MRADTVTLISQPYPDQDPVLTEVLVEVSSVKSSEYYKAMSAGIMPERVFKVFFGDYSDENFLEYNGKMWKIERTYLPNESNYIELVCSGFELGQHNVVIKILTKTIGKDSYGFNVETTTETADIYAYRQEKSAQKDISVEGDFPYKTVNFRFKLPDGFQLSYQDVVECEGEKYNILGIIKIPGRETFVELTCKTGVLS
jgi:head-tail adaptor